jgi:hypothetical protein
MTLYHYCVLGKPEAAHSLDSADAIDMENVDYKRQPETGRVAAHIESRNGLCCGIFHGGMFGLATNQVAVLSAWPTDDFEAAIMPGLARHNQWSITEQVRLRQTVRPLQAEAIDRRGIYVIRWIRMLTSDIDEYTRLCLETWPRFEAATRSRCYGVFQPLEDSEVSRLLMLTWYATLTDWENSRQLDPADSAKWGRRSEMELSHWAQAGRLA